MAINPIHLLTDYDVNSNVTEDNTEFKTTSPCFKFDQSLSPYILKNMTRFHNETFTLYFKAVNVTTFKLLVMIGSDVTGNGYAISLENNSIKLVNTAIFVPQTEFVIKDLTRILSMENDTYYKLSIMVANNKLECFIDDMLVLDYTPFLKYGDYFGYHLNGGTSNVYVSDTIYFDDQILWGEVALVSTPDEDGFVLLFDQTDIGFISRGNCNVNGNYLIFVDEDPLDQNLHIMVGAISTELQPKGISNVTI